MEESLTLLYTANLRGNIARLPRLHTFLQRLKQRRVGPSLLLDLGGACDDEVWHCRRTGGRSMLIMLDGMGYHAANVQGMLTNEDREKLAGQLTMALVDSARPWLYQGPPKITAALSPRDDSPRLQILLSPADRTFLTGNILRLENISGDEVGEARLNLCAGPRLMMAETHLLPADTPPDSSISGAVEFVESEARLYSQS